MIWIAPSLVLALVSWFLVTNSRAATESASYQTLLKDGDCELRAYDRLHLAQVTFPATDPRSKNMDGSFMKLFRFIDGANDREEKIAMTTPVLVQRGEKASSMSFVMPKEPVSKGLPTPMGEVKLMQMPAVKIIARRYSGVSNASKEAEQLRELRAWAVAKGYETEGDAIMAFYDPPWTLGFLRRNEVLLRVKEK